MERAGVGCGCRGGSAARARRLSRRGPSARRLPSRPALQRGPPAPNVPRGRGEGHRLPRGLRRRGARPARAARRDGRASLAPGGEPVVERLAVELFADDEHGGFFLSPADGEELVARKKDLEDHPTPSGNSMLASVAASPGADLRRRRPRAPRDRRERLVHGAVTRAPSGVRPRAVGTRASFLAASRDRNRRPRSTRPSPKPHSSRSGRTRSSGVGPSEDVQLPGRKGPR